MTNHVHRRGRFSALAALHAALLPAAAGNAVGATPPPDSAPMNHRQDDEQRGLIPNTDAAFSGYTLFAPQHSTTTYLVDMNGEVAHSWPSRYTPGEAVYLLDDGSILRCAREPRNPHFRGGGIGGRVERISPDGAVTWTFVYADGDHCLHHDIEPLPNGNVLMIAWERKTREEAIAAGADPQRIRGSEIWPDCIIEVRPEGAEGGTIVWEWHVWDHLVQEFDQGKPNYGQVSEHPQRIDLNFRRNAPTQSPEQLEWLRATGYIGGGEPEDQDAPRPGDDDDHLNQEADDPGGRGDDQGRDRPRGGPRDRRRGPDMQSDWCHTNSVAYNPQLDQIVLSVHHFSEIWIIDHGTTTQQAASSSGGRCGKGGDLLYRWGNPRAYGAGEADDQQLFAQHDAGWIPPGSPGAGHVLVFNNGTFRPGPPYSSIVEIALPADAAGRYALSPGEPFGPAEACWEYTAARRPEFFSGHLSGAQRLPNGNTLICSGEQGRLFEVTPQGKTVWEYLNPYMGRPGSHDGEGQSGRGHPGFSPARERRDGRPGGRPNGPSGERPDGPPRGRAEPPDAGPRGGFMRGGPPNGALFRATRLSPDHPGVVKILPNGVR